MKELLVIVFLLVFFSSPETWVNS